MSDYPLMPAVVVGNKLVNLKWKRGHVKAGQYVIFENKAEEKAFSQADAEPETVRHQGHGEDVYWSHAHARVTGR